MASTLNIAKLYDVTGLVAVVTGGGTGIGLMIARALENNGAVVYITGRRMEKLQEAVKLAEHGNMIPIQGSTNSHEDLQRAVDQVKKQTGYIDLLVNNAGQTTWDTSPNARPMPTKESSISEIREYFFNHRPVSVWNDALETNITGVFQTSMAFLELLDEGNKRREKGKPSSQIVTIGSTGGKAITLPSFVYNASKSGVSQLMQSIGNFLVPHDIRTNIIAPGWFPSDMTTPTQKMFDEKSGGVIPRELVPSQRMGNEEEMAGTILYLASKAGAYVNGHVLSVNGGFTLVQASSS
ncbi:Hypothetical protein R9X50_00291800 [Acrodontium crateriforme]|uniref:Uncharacterized protein n=1 Tax=Acrodontium crateriforme TaxID=150365 RepID=A0AAQ3M3F4_9PEZI|nr:Hypothetical protein R9X50_00291800 [Acrodontium crateriforme]